VTDAALILLFLIGLTAVYGGVSAALLAALVAGAMYLLPKRLEDLKVPLFMLFLAIVGASLLPAIGGLVLDSIAETFVYVLDWLAGTLAEYGIVGAVAILIFVAVAAILLKRLLSDRGVRRSVSRYWHHVKKEVRRFGR